MKKLLAIALAGSCAVTVFGQAQIQFNTKVSAQQIDAPITETVNQATATKIDGTDTLFRAALMGGPTSETASTQAADGTVTLGTLINPTALNGSPSTTWVNFRVGVAAGYLAGGTFVIPNVAAGEDAQLQLVGWYGNYDSFSAAVAAGAPVGLSDAITVTTSSSPDPTQTAYLTGIKGFNIGGGGAVIPEPSTFALAGLGAAALLIFRRRK